MESWSAVSKVFFKLNFKSVFVKLSPQEIIGFGTSRFFVLCSSNQVITARVGSIPCQVLHARDVRFYFAVSVGERGPTYGKSGAYLCMVTWVCWLLLL